jgi:hypothetical protein
MAAENEDKKKSSYVDQLIEEAKRNSPGKGILAETESNQPSPSDEKDK